MKNTKVLMSLVAASIAAMAAAPDLVKEAQAAEQEPNTINSSEHKLIELKSQSSEVDPTVQAEIQAQVQTMLVKKTPVTKLGESISILVDNYGEKNASLKSQIFAELNLGVLKDDSVIAVPNITPAGAPGVNTGTTLCHAACHGACHSACHGSRGWR